MRGSTLESTINELSPVLYEVSVEVPWDEVSKDLEAGYRELARSARVKGFRRGKVPKHIVKKLFGAQVKSEVTGTLVERGLMVAVEKHQLYMVAQPEVTPEAITDGDPFRFLAKVEVRPKVESVSFDGMTVYEEKVEIADEKITEELETLQKRHADVQEPDPMRPAIAGDELKIDYTVELDGEAKEEMAAEDRRIELGEGNLLEEFDTGLMGAQPGEEKTIEVTFPEDHPNEEIKGKTAKFLVKVTGLMERVLPELDDDFAQDCGDFETLADLKADIEKRLTEAAQNRADASLKEQLLDELIRLNDVEVPPSMLKQQQQAMFYEMANLAQMMGQGFDPSMFGDVEVRAKRRVQAGILLGAVARIDEIEVDQDAIDAKFQEIAETTGKHIAKVRADHRGERLEQLQNQLLEEKLMAHLKEKATINEGPRPEAAEEGEKSE